MRKIGWLLIAGALLAFSSMRVMSDGAGVPSAIVVSACGTVTATYTVGKPGALTIDTTGKLCTG